MNPYMRRVIALITVIAASTFLVPSAQADYWPASACQSFYAAYGYYPEGACDSFNGTTTTTVASTTTTFCGRSCRSTTTTSTTVDECTGRPDGTTGGVDCP